MRIIPLVHSPVRRVVVVELGDVELHVDEIEAVWTFRGLQVGRGPTPRHAWARA